MYQGLPGADMLRWVLDSNEEEEAGKIYDWKVIRRLPKYLASVKGLMALGAAGMILRSLASLAVPYLIGVAIDKYITPGDLSGLNIIILLFIGSAVLVWAGEYIEDLFLAFAADVILLKLRTELFDHIQQLSLSFFDRNKAGRIMSRLQNDIQQIEELLTSSSLNIVTNFVTLIGIAVILAVTNPHLTLLTFSVLPVLAVVIVIWQKYARRSFIRVRHAIAGVNSQLQESISGVRAVQSLSREKTNMKQFDEVNRNNLKVNIEASRLTSVMMPVIELLTAAATALVIFFGGRLALSGQIGVGAVLAFLLYVQRFFNPVLELASEYTSLQRAMVSGARMFGLLDIKPEVADAPNAIELESLKGDIRLEHVSFGYSPEREILHDVNLVVKPGETAAVVGRTGAGKSSLVNLVARFYEVTQGAIYVGGHDIRAVTQQSLRRQMGIVPQDPFLFSGTIEENIRHGCLSATHDEILTSAKAVGIHDFIMKLEKGYDTQVGQRGVNLSAGQRQFICLARAIVGNPPILILDEATSNIDSASERLLQRSLRKLLKERTSLIVAHRLSTVTTADRIIVLDKGRVVEAGPHNELVKNRGLYYQMYQTLAEPDWEA